MFQSNGSFSRIGLVSLRGLNPRLACSAYPARNTLKSPLSNAGATSTPLLNALNIDDGGAWASPAIHAVTKLRDRQPLRSIRPCTGGRRLSEADLRNQPALAYRPPRRKITGLVIGIIAVLQHRTAGSHTEPAGLSNQHPVPEPGGVHQVEQVTGPVVIVRVPLRQPVFLRHQALDLVRAVHEPSVPYELGASSARQVFRSNQQKLLPLPELGLEHVQHPGEFVPVPCLRNYPNARLFRGDRPQHSPRYLFQAPCRRVMPHD